ncbi:hypothetical protein ACJMK2_008872 [Sinanodonta woodiana]|uniref:Uncharacterized protein n=1 Tax=Sinanodonta woodiana TaxID=1069815 RepID=A0ABD3VC36_SINWO
MGVDGRVLTGQTCVIPAGGGEGEAQSTREVDFKLTTQAKHRENVRKYRKKSQEPEAANQNTGTNGRLANDAELWARLDELERIEAEKNELTNLGLDEEKLSSAGESLSLPTPKSTGNEKRVHWENQSPPDEEEEEESDSLDSDDDTNDEKDERINSDASSSVRISKTILFTHSKVQPETNEASLQNNPDLPQEGPTIQTPADIIRLVTVPNVPKSILKNRDTIPVNLEAAAPVYVENNLVKATEKDSTRASTVTAFSGKVMEKEPAVQDLDVDAKPKKMSKFRAQRQSQARR